MTNDVSVIFGGNLIFNVYFLKALKSIFLKKKSEKDRKVEKLITFDLVVPMSIKVCDD